MRTIAVVPARSGSKGLVNKNIKMLQGKPLLAHSVEAALNSGVTDVVHVSTDSEEYAGIAGQIPMKIGMPAKENAYAGPMARLDIPFLRDESVSGDLATTWDTMRWVLNEYEKRGEIFDTLIVLQPTSPLRTAQDIQNAMKLYQEKNAKSVISVCEADHSPRWMNILPEDGSLCGFIDDSSSAPRQTLGKYYRLNGAIYIVDVELLKSKESLYGKDSYAYIMEPSHSVDIDTELDFIIAEAIMRSKDLE